MTELLTELRARLLEDAFLFDDPAAYQAGVMDAFDVLEARTPTLTRTHRTPPGAIAEGANTRHSDGPAVNRTAP